MAGGNAAVSVVIPCYRCAGTIERAVRSVAAQTRRPAELILVDDGSPDETGAVLERLRERYGADWIRVIRLPKNLGSASARNAGWEAATQPYLAFLDSDDAWHPRKIEIQQAWMDAHPDVAVSGHGALQIGSESDMQPEPDGGEAQAISRRSLLASNPFITPSVMLRTGVAARFEPGKRHMEDYLLWLEIAAGGGRIVRLPQVLAYTFKAPFGEGGLSAQAWNMERGELAAFATLWRKNRIGAGTVALLSVFSLLKFLRRMLMLATGYSPGGVAAKPKLLYAGAYLVLTQAMTALLVCAGLFGRSELAAEIGIAQAATLATFFAFSGNARNLILSERTEVPARAILAARMALLLPLGAAAVLLCTIVGRLDPALMLVLIVRRAIEWIGELHLSDCELKGDHAAARRSLMLQGALLGVAAVAVFVDSRHLLWVLAAWALLPVFSLAGFVARGFAVSVTTLREAVTLLLPHYGATVASGVSLYVFRALLVLIAGKPVAGVLFAAFAIGSFPGSMFANVLGPTVSLHEERIGRAYLPKALWLVTTAYLFGGVVLLGLHWASPWMFAAISVAPLFWTALGWSLLGGVAMIVAQRLRLRLLAGGDGRLLFGADVLMHIYLIAAVPALYAVGRIESLVLLYALNAGLALLFYAAAVRGEVAPYGERTAGALVFGATFLIFLPLFFLVSGQLFNPAFPLYDSGGVLRNLPLPVSLLACSAGLLLFGRYSRATPGLWTIFGLLVLMLISTAVAGGEPGPLDRAKMLLLLQIILPMLGLVLGACIDPAGPSSRALQLAVLAVVALVVPAQLLASWLDGSRTLRHSVFLFGVYQHIQFVPTILVCGFLAVLPGLWDRWRAAGRFVLAVLFCLLAAYSVAAHAVVAMFGILAGAAVFGIVRLIRQRDRAAAWLLVAIVASFAGYVSVAKDTQEFHQKFSFLFPAGDDWVTASSYTPGVRPRLQGGWRIVGQPQGGELLRLVATERGNRATLVVAGELQEGAINFAVEDKVQRTFPVRLSVRQSGPFHVEIEVDQDRGDGNVMVSQEPGAASGTITDLRWRLQPHRRAEEIAAAQDPQAASARNVEERFADWRLFGGGVLESPEALFFGHPKPLGRDQRTSAHNFYIDFAYSFGALALLPLLALIAYTAALLWHRRDRVLASEPLLGLALVVALLVLVESNLKVSLRQPYPGIAIYFLWGLLLACLREPIAAREKAA